MSINFEDLDDGEAALNDMTVEGEVQRVSRQHVSSSDFIRLAQRSEETTSHQKLSHEQNHGNTTFPGPDRPPEDSKKRPKKARKLHLARLAHLDGDTKARVDRSVQTAHVKSWLHSHGYVVKADKLHPAVARLIADWFNLVDQDGSRTLEHHELLAALKAARVPCDDATISEMIQMMDMNKDGVIDWDEFEVFMTEEFAAGKSLLSGEYLLPSGATINFGVMIGQLKRNRLLTDIMQDAQRRSKWASIAANPDALRRELAMLQEAAEATSLATLERAKRSDASGGGRPTTPRGVLAAAMMRSAPDGLGGVVPGSGGGGGGAGWGQQQQSAVAAEVMARTVRIKDKLRASAAVGWEHHAASQYTASAAAEYDKAASEDGCLAYGGYGHGSAGPSAVGALAAGAAGMGAHGTHPWRGPAFTDPTSQGPSTLPSQSQSHSGQLRLDGTLGGIGGYLYGLSTATAAASTADNNSHIKHGSNSPLASPRASAGDDLLSISSTAAASGLFALTSVSLGEHLAVQRQIAAVPSSPHVSTDPLTRLHRPVIPSALLGPCPQADLCSPETSAWLLTGRDGAHRATATATGATATGLAACPGFQGAGSSAATPGRNHSTPPAFRRSPARTAPAPAGPGFRLQECNSEPRHVLMPTVASLRQRRPLSRTMSHVAEMAKTLRAQTVRLPPEALDPANTLPAAMLAGCAFTATTTTGAAAATAGPGTGALTQLFRSNYNIINNSSNSTNGIIGSSATTVGANRSTTGGATSGRFPTVDGCVPAARSFELQGSSVTQGDGGEAAALTFTALQRPETAVAVTEGAAESALGGGDDGDVGAAYSHGLTPAVLLEANTEYSQMPMGLVVDSVAAAGRAESETSDWGTMAAAAMTAAVTPAVGAPSGGRPGKSAATGFGSCLPELAHSIAEERHSHSGPLTIGHTTTTVEPAVLSERLLSFSVYDSPFAQKDGADSPAHQAANDRHGNTPPATPQQHAPPYAAASSPHSQQLLNSGSLSSSTAVLQHNYFTQGPGDKALRPSASLARNRTGGGLQPPSQSPLVTVHSSLTSTVPILRQQPPLYIIGSPSVSRTTSPPRVASDPTACSNSISGGASGPAPSITSSCSSFPPSVASQGSTLLAPAPAGTVDATPGLLTQNNSLPELPGSAPRRDGGGVGIGGGVGGGIGGSRRRGDESGPATRRPQHHYGGRGRTLAQQRSVGSADADLTRQLADITCGPWGSLGDYMGRPGSEAPPVAERSAPAAVAGASLAAASAAAAAAVGASTSATGSSSLSFAAARAGGGGKGAAAADSGIKRHTPSPTKTGSTPVVNLGAQGTTSTVSSAPCIVCTVNTTATTTSAGTASTASATSTTGGGGTGGNVTPLGSMSGSEVMAWPTAGGDGANLLSSPNSGASCASGGTATSSSRPATTASALLGPQASSTSATTARDVGSPSRTRPPAIPEVKMAPNWGASTASLLQLRLAKHLDELLPRS